jgi:hypothetical protein
LNAATLESGMCVPKKRNEFLACSLPIVGKAALELFWELGYTVPKGLSLVAPCKPSETCERMATHRQSSTFATLIDIHAELSKHD